MTASRRCLRSKLRFRRSLERVHRKDIENWREDRVPVESEEDRAIRREIARLDAEMEADCWFDDYDEFDDYDDYDDDPYDWRMVRS